MRVLHFLPVYLPAWQYGGPILSVSRLCEALVKQGVDVRVITTNAGLPSFPSDQLGVPQTVNGVPVTYYPVDKPGGIIRSTTLVDSLSHHISWAQLVHLSSVWQPLGIPIQKAAHLAGVPVIQTLRGALGPYSWTRSPLKKFLYFLLTERRYLQRSASIHCTTLQESNEIRWLRLNPPIHVLPNPLDLSTLYPHVEFGKRWRLQHNLPLDTTLFAVIGRIHHKKGMELLPKVLKRLESKNWHLIIIGDDQDGSGLSFRHSLDNLGLSSRCTWFESMPADQLIHPLNASDWLLLPSRHENFGNVAVEALSCGCGVVLSDRVGVTEMLAGCPGVYAGPRSTSVWTDLLANCILSSRPGISSHIWVTEGFSASLIAQRAENLYSQLISNA